MDSPAATDRRPRRLDRVKLRNQLIKPLMRALERTDGAGLALAQPLDPMTVGEQHRRQATFLPPAPREKGINPGKKGLDKHGLTIIGTCPEVKSGQNISEEPLKIGQNLGMSLKLKTPTILSERVRERLNALELSPHAASMKLGRGASYVRDIIRLRTRNPGAEALADLARVLKCSPFYLLGQTDDVGAPPPEGAALATPGQFRTAPLMIAHDVAAGRWNEVDDLMQVEPEQSPLASDPQWPHMDQYACRVVGPSMNEFYPPGSFVRLVSIHALRGYTPATGDHVEVVRRRDGGSLLEFTLKEVVVAPDGAIELACRSTDPKFAGTKIPYRDGVAPDDDGAEVSIRGLVTGDFRPRPVRR